MKQVLIELDPRLEPLFKSKKSKYAIDAKFVKSNMREDERKLLNEMENIIVRNTETFWVSDVGCGDDDDDYDDNCCCGCYHCDKEKALEKEQSKQCETAIYELETFLAETLKRVSHIKKTYEAVTVVRSAGGDIKVTYNKPDDRPQMTIKKYITKWREHYQAYCDQQIKYKKYMELKQEFEN